MEVLAAGYLLVNSWTDWRRKEVDIVWTVAVVILTALIYVGTVRNFAGADCFPVFFCGWHLYGSRDRSEAGMELC